MGVLGEEAEERLENVIRPYEKAIEAAESMLENSDFSDMMGYFENIEGWNFSEKDFEDCRTFGEVFDLESYEKEYASKLGGVGFLIPEESWNKKFLESLEVEGAEAVHIEGTEFDGPFGLTGLSLTPDNKELDAKQTDVLHESMHSAFAKYSFFYAEKRDAYMKSKTEEEIISAGLEYVEMDILNELNSYRCEPKESWNEIQKVMEDNYLGMYRDTYLEVEILERVYDIKSHPSKGRKGKEEKRIRKEVKQKVDNAFTQIPEKAELACLAMEELEKRYSNSLISHIIYNCASIEDLAGFEINDTLKKRVVESLESYASKDGFYTSVLEEAREKFTF